MKKILAVFMAFVICVGLVAGCGKKADDATEAPANQNNSSDDVIATIGEYEITIDMLPLYLDQAVSMVQSETGNAPGWDAIVVSDGITARDAALNLALEYVQYDYASILEAKDLGIYSEEESEEFVNSFIEYNGGEESFYEAMEMYGYDPECYRTYLRAMHAYQSISAMQCTEEEAAEQFNALYGNGDYYMAKHILFTFDTRDENEALKEANSAYDRAIAGESFEDLIGELDEDPGQNPEIGYLFTDGEMVEEFENAVKTLSIGEISKPVKTDYGYHVIKRYDIPQKGDAAYEEYIYEMRITIGSSYMTEEKINEIFDKHPITIDDSKYSKIDLSKYTAVN